jgi:hypothetical protein
MDRQLIPLLVASVGIVVGRETVAVFRIIGSRHCVCFPKYTMIRELEIRKCMVSIDREEEREGAHDYFFFSPPLTHFIRLYITPFSSYFNQSVS